MKTERSDGICESRGVNGLESCWRRKKITEEELERSSWKMRSWSGLLEVNDKVHGGVMV